MNTHATFENDPRKIILLRTLTMIFNVGSWKNHKKNCAYDKTRNYINQHVQPYICTKFGDFGLRNEPAH